MENNIDIKVIAEALVRKMEENLSFYKDQQRQTKDEKRKWYWLGRMNSTTEDIANIKNFFKV
jgi:hypothetical protein